MRTSSPISTISYNSAEFLKMKLDELHRNKKIDDYFFIKHYAEEDESKDHIHLWISPNRLLDTMDLQEHFIEPNPADPAHPFGCIFFQTSKPDDAVLYFIHDKDYLAFKGQSRKYSYTFDDVVKCNDMSFEARKIHAMYESEFSKWRRSMEVLRDGMAYPADLILSGQIPLQQAASVRALRIMMEHGGTTYRAGKETHSPIVDIETGEIVRQS